MSSSFSDFARFFLGLSSRPHPDNIRESLAARAQRKPLGVLLLHLNSVHIARATPRGRDWRLDSHTSFPSQDERNGDLLPAEALSGLKERSPTMHVAVGLGVKVTAKMVPYDAEVVDRLTQSPGAHPQDDERVAWLWHEPSGKMLRFGVQLGLADQIERKLAESGLKPLRLDLLPHTLMNALLAHGEDHVGAGRKILLILDASLVQGLAIGADGKWQDYRAMPVFASSDSSAETLRNLLVSLMKNSPAELVVLNTNTAPDAAEKLETALRMLAAPGSSEFAGTRPPGFPGTRPPDLGGSLQPTKVVTLNSGSHLDAHALLLHP